MPAPVNLVTNPSFETAAASVVVRTNVNLNPRMDNAIAYWTVANGAVQTPAVGGTVLDFATGGADALPVMYPASAFPGSAAPGEGWSASYEVSVPVGFPAVTLRCTVVGYAGGSGVSGSAPGASTTINPGETKTLSMSQTLLPTTDGVRGIIYAAGVIPSGARLIVRNALLEKSPIVQPFFCGGVDPLPLDPDFISPPSWVSLPNQSISNLRGVGLASVNGGNTYPIQSSHWAVAGPKSLRVLNTGVSATASVLLTATLLPARTYTMVGTARVTAPVTDAVSYTRRIVILQTGFASWVSPQYPNVPGVYPLRFSFTTDPAMGAYTIRLGGPGAVGENVWWDDIAIYEGTQTLEEYWAPYSLADLELAYLKTIGATGPTLADARFQIRGENDHAYFAGLSGLTPAQAYTLADHQWAYYRAQTGQDGTLADLSKAFWTARAA